MQIAIVTGSLPPDICGCGDYVESLGKALRLSGVKTEIFYRKDWSLRNLLRYAQDIRNLGAEFVNIQYPTAGYGRSVVPMLLCCLLKNHRKIVTLHEFSRMTANGKVAIGIFALFADWVIFTTDFELNAASQLFPWLKAKASVIHIGSNIPFREQQQADTDVAYFGLIRPVKGIEEFIATLSRPDIGPTLRIRVIGEVSAGYESYASEMIARLEALGAEILLNRSAGEVSELLSRTKIALLPFPDGMSRRRGSALAAMGNGALVVTNAGSTETDMFRNLCAMPVGDSSLWEVLRNAIEDYDSYQSIRRAGQEFARSISWDGIGKTYVSVFERLLCAQRRTRSLRRIF